VTSYYTLTSDQIQALNTPASRFAAYVAFYDPLAFTQASQDLSTQNGTVVVPPPTDLLAQQRSPFVPTPVFGSNRIGFVGEPLYFDGSRSTQRHNILAWGHQWTATGPATITTFSTPATYSSIFPGTFTVGGQQAAITWSAPGTYLVTLTVSDRYGHSATGSRFVRIYQDRQDAEPGIVSIDSITGDMTNGGWSMQLTTVAGWPGFVNPDSLPVGSYLPCTVIIETASMLTPGVLTPRTIGQWGDFVPGQPYTDPRILLSGYVQQRTCHEDDAYDTIQLTVQTPEVILQEANIVTVAFYNAAWSTTDTHGRWNGQSQITSMSDQLVADLMVEDIIKSMCSDHSTLGAYHDIVTWNRYMIDPAQPSYGTEPTYTSLTMNQGTIWAALQTLVQNDFSMIWGERDGSIRAGPTINYRGAETWQWYFSAPQLPIAQVPANNPGVWPPRENPLSTGLSYNTGFPATIGGTGDLPPQANTEVTMVNAWQMYSMRNEFYPAQVLTADPYGYISYTPPTPGWCPVLYTLWGPNAIPQPANLDGVVRSTQNCLIMPVVCHFSDLPEYDGTQEISLAPQYIDDNDLYYQRTAFTKLIGYKIQNDAAWSANYPQGIFDQQGQQQYRMPVGNFSLIDNLVLPDMTTSAGLQIGWSYLWNMAAIVYFAQNARYTVTITTGPGNYLNLHDLVYISRQKPSKGPSWWQKLFYVANIQMTFDLTNRVWMQQIQCSEVTSNTPVLRSSINPPWLYPGC
jgi:hypothetical protein